VAINICFFMRRSPAILKSNIRHIHSVGCEPADPAMRPILQDSRGHAPWHR
jgi:hypothetical protein